jgi:archaellin
MIKKSNKKGEAGISILIIMVTSILITLLVIGVYIYSTNKFQNKAQTTTDKTKNNLFNKLTITDVHSEYDSNNMIQKLEVTAKVEKSSQGIDFNELTIKIVSPYSASNQIAYRPNGLTTKDATNGYYTNETTGNGYFTIEYLAESNFHQEGMLFPGDVVKIYFETREPLDTEDEVTLRFIPKNGAETIQMFITPRTAGIGRVSLGHY